MSADDKGSWTLDAGARSRIDVELQVIDIANEAKRLPKCELCGQQANALDKHGLCSKTDINHIEWRRGGQNSEVRFE